ncbi:DUF3299 domain-containing protein [Methylonatrum kenyense]|uniref:DUF3299 domain-containing protein n=1 Tax=Methylonatrum kenyense TaxID=455253 RepID=UPI0020BFD788|nr:DUF3299 domain-containing protein [Methylonatrum kenyense]MCK8515579.1 DUF3299 domain-containing protein [Methylonatrum kenyense]
MIRSSPLSAHLPSRMRLVLMVILLAGLLVACSDDAEYGSSVRDSEPAMAQEPTEAAAAESDKPALRVYITRLRDYGEVAGITAASDEFVDLTLRMEAADGTPLAATDIEISSLVGNELSESVVATDADGNAELRIKPQLPGDDVLTFLADGVSRQVTLYITDDAYGHPMEHMEERATELPEVDGVIAWDRLTAVATEEGDYGLLKPLFDDDLRALHGTEVKVQGFMLPLENDDKHSHFIVTRSPPSCFFCLPGGPESVVEIKAEKPLEFSFDPVVLKGRLALLEDSEMGLFYRLENATLE